MAKKTDEIKIKVTSETKVARKGIADLAKRLNQLEKQAARAGAAMNKASANQANNAAAMARVDQVYQKTTRSMNTLSGALLGIANDWMRSSRA